jgi:molecular chaperone GrpE
MTKEKKEHANGTHIEHDEEQPNDEKLFDFDKSNPDIEESNAPSGEATDTNISDLVATVKELKDKHLRLLAEFDNYKKRTLRERLELMSSASKDVIASLLPILDDFDRAKKSADDPNTAEGFSDGVTLVYNRLNAILQGMGLKVMESDGQAFDPEWHNAITEIPAPQEELKGKVIDTIEKGYMLNDKIIRHAKVVVGN